MKILNLRPGKAPIFDHHSLGKLEIGSVIKGTVREMTLFGESTIAKRPIGITKEMESLSGKQLLFRVDDSVYGLVLRDLNHGYAWKPEWLERVRVIL